MLRYDPQLKPGEANKFHQQWEGPYDIVERVTDDIYRVKKVRGRSRKSQVVHFNNLRLYRRRQEGSMERKGAKEAADAPQEGNGAGEQVWAILGVVSMAPDTAEEVVWVAARSEGYKDVVDMPDKSISGDLPQIADSALEREVQQGAGSDNVVDILAADGGGLFENESCDRNGGDRREDEPE